MTLSHVPSELLGLIINHLRPSPLPLGDTVPRSYRPRQTALRNLCLASRQLHAIAQPGLYHTIVLYDHPYAVSTLYRLVRTLANRPELALLLRDLAVTINYDATPDGHVPWIGDLDLPHRFPGTGTTTFPFWLIPQGPDIRADGAVLERLLGCLLCLTNNCTRLLLELPVSGDLWALQEVLQQHIVGRVLARSDDTLPLPNLRTLRVQGHPKTNGKGLYLESANMQACPILLGLPSIHTFELYHVDVVNHKIQHNHDNWPGQVHTMRLYTGMSAINLNVLLLLPGGLKALELVLECYEEDDVSSREYSVSTALAKACALECLRLLVSTESQSAAGYTGILGNELRIDCLPNIHELRILC